MVCDVHYLAHILDPWESPSTMPAEHRIPIHRLLMKSLNGDEAETMTVMMEIGNFMTRAGSFQGVPRPARHPTGKDGKLLHLDALSWWAVFGSTSPLFPIARQVLSLTTSGCNTERSFSCQGNIHTRIRNKLRQEKVEKLLFVSWTLRLLHGVSSEVLEDTTKSIASLGQEEESISSLDRCTSGQDDKSKDF